MFIKINKNLCAQQIMNLQYRVFCSSICLSITALIKINLFLNSYLISPSSSAAIAAQFLASASLLG